LAGKAGIHHTGDLSAFRKKISGLDKQSVKYLPPYRLNIFSNSTTFLDIRWRKPQLKRAGSFIVAVAGQRNIKSQEEIEEIERAVDVTSDMHLAAMHYARAGMTKRR
jgi:Xaa-Pro aminopeptidase